MKTKVLVMFICLSLLLAGCSSSVDKVGGSGSSEKDIKKFNSYIELLNFNDDWLRGIAKVYFKQFGTDEEIVIKKDFNGFTLFSSADGNGVNLYEMHKGHTQLPRKYQADQPSYGDIDAKMLTLCDKFDAFIELYFKDVNAYYANKEYESDNFAKGREFHKKMVLCYKELLKAEADFSIAFYPKTVEHAGADLPKFKEKGYNIHYYTLNVLLTSKEISHMFSELEADGKDFLQADLAKYEELNNKFNANVAELQKIYNDNSQLKKERYTGTQASFLNQFVDTAKRMQIAATDTLNMIKAGTTEVKNENTGKVTTGGRNNPMSRFNQRLDVLIGEYNNTI
jgi:hypothetical protein